jgi:hypothetical protein
VITSLYTNSTTCCSEGDEAITSIEAAALRISPSTPDFKRQTQANAVCCSTTKTPDLSEASISSEFLIAGARFVRPSDVRVIEEYRLAA